MPATVKAHIALCFLSFIVQASEGVEGWSRTTSQMVIFLWACALIGLYIVLVQRRRNWARIALVVLTLPFGLLLMTDSAKEYVGI